MKPATIKDVAREANVSLASVSRALNHDACVSEKLQLRVMEAAQKLGYVPNSAAKSLKTNSTFTIGFVVSDISNYYYITLARIVEDMVGQHNYSMMLCSTANNPQQEQAYLQMLMSKNIDGLILNTTGFNDELILKMNEKTPMVLLNRGIGHPDFVGDLVDTDGYAGCYELTKHLLTLGHRKIFVVRGPTHLSNSVNRFQGFKDAMAEAGITVDERYPYVYTGEFTEQSGMDAIDHLMTLSDQPTAILTQNNMSTVGAIKGIQRNALRVPEDLSMVAYDAIDNFDLLSVRPTSASFDMQAVGTQIGLSMLRRIHDPTLPSKEYIFKPTLLQGNSLSLPAINR